MRDRKENESTSDSRKDQQILIRRRTNLSYKSSPAGERERWRFFEVFVFCLELAVSLISKFSRFLLCIFELEQDSLQLPQQTLSAVFSVRTKTRGVFGGPPLLMFEFRSSKTSTCSESPRLPTFFFFFDKKKKKKKFFFFF